MKKQNNNFVHYIIVIWKVENLNFSLLLKTLVSISGVKLKINNGFNSSKAFVSLKNC